MKPIKFNSTTEYRFKEKWTGGMIQDLKKITFIGEDGQTITDDKVLLSPARLMGRLADMAEIVGDLYENGVKTPITMEWIRELVENDYINFENALFARAGEIIQGKVSGAKSEVQSAPQS